MTSSGAVVLGSGPLAIRIADWFYGSSTYELLGVVCRREEPAWAAKLSDWASERGVQSWREYESVPADVLAFSCFYDRILAGDFLARCRLALNLHAGPLPRYRGMRPVNWALKNGEREHGVTIHGIDEGVDTGPLYAQARFTIWPEIDEVKDVYERCLQYGWLLFADTIERIDAITPIPQADEDALTYTGKDVDRLEERSSWTREESIRG
jgi:methionyl-tRNA formyltransferase